MNVFWYQLTLVVSDKGPLDVVLVLLFASRVFMVDFYVDDRRFCKLSVLNCYDVTVTEAAGAAM